MPAKSKVDPKPAKSARVAKTAKFAKTSVKTGSKRSTKSPKQSAGAASSRAKVGAKVGVDKAAGKVAKVEPEVDLRALLTPTVKNGKREFPKIKSKAIDDDLSEYIQHNPDLEVNELIEVAHYHPNNLFNQRAAERLLGLTDTKALEAVANLLDFDAPFGGNCARISIDAWFKLSSRRAYEHFAPYLRKRPEDIVVSQYLFEFLVDEATDNAPQVRKRRKEVGIPLDCLVKEPRWLDLCVELSDWERRRDYCMEVLRGVGDSRFVDVTLQRRGSYANLAEWLRLLIVPSHWDPKRLAQATAFSKRIKVLVGSEKNSRKKQELDAVLRTLDDPADGVKAWRDLLKTEQKADNKKSFEFIVEVLQKLAKNTKKR
ncbi:MAG TPA: hypothetical protein VKP30_15155 [Polyangiaceae bacterium]|nr:hypothetical protein [Polyangiaceae bacterium]